MERGKYKEADRVADYQAVFSSETGKRVLYDLLLHHNFMNPTYDEIVSRDSILVNEGQRSVILRILRQLELDARDVYQLIESARAEEKTYGTTNQPFI